MTSPLHLVEIAIEALSQADADKLHDALERISAGDDSFAVTTDRESGQTILSASNERHLETSIARLQDEFDINVRVGAPQVCFRETLSRPVTVDHTYKRQIGDRGEFARVKIEFEPLLPGSGYVFENDCSADAIPTELVPAIDKGIQAQKDGGLLAGFLVIDFRARLVGGAYHEVDSNALTFEIAGRAAFRELARENAAALLEPFMRIEVITPDNFIGSVILDLNSRRGYVQTTDSRGDVLILTATVPLAELFGYENFLASMTQNAAQCIMHFDRYEPVPKSPDDDPDYPFPVAAALRVA
jgi:elongation factor G